MRAIAINNITRIVGATAKQNGHSLQIFTLAMLGACFITAVLYAINLYSLISYTVVIQRAETRSAALSGDLSRLDSEYLKLSTAITPDSLAKHGLAEGHVSIYITRPAPTASRGDLAALSHEL